MRKDVITDFVSLTTSVGALAGENEKESIESPETECCGNADCCTSGSETNCC